MEGAPRVLREAASTVRRPTPPPDASWSGAPRAACARSRWFHPAQPITGEGSAARSAPGYTMKRSLGTSSLPRSCQYVVFRKSFDVYFGGTGIVPTSAFLRAVACSAFSRRGSSSGSSQSASIASSLRWSSHVRSQAARVRIPVSVCRHAAEVGNASAATSSSTSEPRSTSGRPTYSSATERNSASLRASSASRAQLVRRGSPPSSAHPPVGRATSRGARAPAASPTAPTASGACTRAARLARGRGRTRSARSAVRRARGSRLASVRRFVIGVEPCLSNHVVCSSPAATRRASTISNARSPKLEWRRVLIASCHR